MRLLLALLIGVVVGAVIMGRSWPATPVGTSLPPTSDVHVSISDAYLSRRVQARVAQSGIVSVKQVRVSSAPPLLVVDARAGVGPFTAPVSMALQPFPSQGNVQVRIISTHVGVVPIPGFLTHIVASSINDSLSHALGANAGVTGVAVTPQGLEVTANFPQ